MNSVNLSQKVCVGLSGGIDSAMTAYYLKEQGYQVRGIFMHNWQQTDCPITEDMRMAREVAAHLGIEFEVLDFSNEYWSAVFQTFLRELSQGLTPNPDILCNEFVKFDAFKQAALKNHSILATGHYAHIQPIDGQLALMQAKDPKKDQTYFLCRLSQEQLQHVMFPLALRLKEEIKQHAHQLKLPNIDRKESMGICFIGQDKLQPFLSEFMLDRPGDIIDTNGRVLGQHRGVFYYTLGQRKGLALGGQKHMSDAPFYVVKKDIKTHTITVSQNEFDSGIIGHQAKVCMLHHIRQPYEEGKLLYGRIRHGQALQECTITDINGEHAVVQFAQQQRALTPGQYVAFYSQDECLGSAKITL